MAFRYFEEKDHAAAYLKYRPSPTELISKIMEFMEIKTPKKFDLAVDVGCGSGQGTVLLASYFKDVVGLDVSPAQLEMASVNAKPPNVSYRQSSAEQLPFASGEVDLVTAMTAAHWFDRPKFLQEVDRVLRPGGCLAVLAYELDMELEYGDVSDILNNICKEYDATLNADRHPYLGENGIQIYSEMFDICKYPDKEWIGCFPVRRTIPLSRYLGMMKTTSLFKIFEKKNPAEAENLTNYVRNKMLSAMNVDSGDTVVTMVVKYYYWVASKSCQFSMQSFCQS